MIASWGPEAAVFWLAFTFGIHIVLVNLGIGISVVAPILKVLADRRGDGALREEAYRLLRFYAATYALGGVFGTAFTVFLLSFYPSFTGLIGKIALYNFAFAIAMIALHFLSLTIYYYGWGKLPARIHNLFGALLAVSALLIPLGFRGVFAQLNQPVGVEIAGVNDVVVRPIAALLENPTLPPLYIKSVSASLALTLVVAAAWAALKGRHEIAKLYLKPGLAFLAIVALAGLWYGWSLRAVEYKFNNIFGGLGIGGEPALNLSWLLALKALLWAVQVAALAYAARNGVEGSATLLALAAGAALITVPAGEYLNAFSQYPHFIAEYEAILASLPPQERAAFEEAISLLTVNVNTESRALMLYTVVATTVLLAAAALYIATVFGPFRKDAGVGRGGEPAA